MNQENTIRFQLLWNEVECTNQELLAWFISLGFFLYASISAPVLTAFFLLFGTTFLAFKVVSLSWTNVSAKLFAASTRSNRSLVRSKSRLKPWQWGIAASVLAIVCSSQLSPARAQFFDALEEQVTTVTAEIGIGDGVIENIFIFLRILIVFAFIAGVIIAFQMSISGGDWRPIANLLTIGVAFVIGIEVITQLMLGDG